MTRSMFGFVARSACLVLLTMTTTFCEEEASGTCYVEAMCDVGPDLDNEIRVECSTFEDGDECRCFENGVEFADCTSQDFCRDTQFAMDHSSRNNNNRDLVPLINSCCRLSYPAVQFDYDNDFEKLNEGCDVLGMSGGT